MFANRADVDIYLTRNRIQHELNLGRLLIDDKFSFVFFFFLFFGRILLEGLNVLITRECK